MEQTDGYERFAAAVTIAIALQLNISILVCDAVLLLSCFHSPIEHAFVEQMFDVVAMTDCHYIILRKPAYRLCIDAV